MTWHGVKFANGEWLERYDNNYLTVEPIGTRDSGKARRFDSKESAEAHIEWATWDPDEATAEPLPERRAQR